MDFQPDIPRPGSRYPAYVQPHSHPKLTNRGWPDLFPQAMHCSYGCSGCGARVCERGKEGVPFRAVEPAIMVGDRLAKDVVMALQDRAPVLTEGSGESG